MIDKIKKIIKIGADNDQNRVIWLEKTLKAIPAGSRILDAGAGEQRFKKFCSHLNYVSQDFAQYTGEGNGIGLQMGKWDQNNLDIVSDIVKISEPDESFDAILCTEVFEHLPDPILAVKEFSRLLKKGGHLIVAAPFCCGTHFAPYYYYTGFSKYFYEAQFSKCGFEIKEIKNNGSFFKYLAQEIRRIPTMVKMYAKTKIRLWEYPILFLVLLVLGRISKNDIKSQEFLNYGLFVHAIKKIKI